VPFSCENITVARGHSYNRANRTGVQYAARAMSWVKPADEVLRRVKPKAISGAVH
jgi:hypothetical protein